MEGVLDLRRLMCTEPQSREERVDLVGGKLRYTWRDRFHLTLEPLAGDLLAIEGVRDFRFRILRKGGKVTALERIDRDGTTQTYARLD